MNDMLIALLGNLTQSLGNLGWAIIALSLGVRLTLLPLTIKLARRAQRNQEIMRALQPQIEELKKRFEQKPQRFFEEISKLYRKHNCRPFDLPAVLASFIQLPIFAMLYTSIRSSISAGGTFVWIRNLASPDFLLTLLILSLTGAAAYFVPSASEQMKSTLIVIQVVVTFFIVWKLAAGLGLYFASSGLVTLLQTLWLRYRAEQRTKMA